MRAFWLPPISRSLALLKPETVPREPPIFDGRLPRGSGGRPPGYRPELVGLRLAPVVVAVLVMTPGWCPPRATATPPGGWRFSELVLESFAGRPRRTGPRRVNHASMSGRSQSRGRFGPRSITGLGISAYFF